MEMSSLQVKGCKFLPLLSEILQRKIFVAIGSGEIERGGVPKVILFTHYGTSKFLL